MKINTKIKLLASLPLLLIILLIGMGSWYINIIKKYKNDIRNSASTIQYAQNLLNAMDALQQQEKSVEDFELNVEKLKNIQLENEMRILMDRIEQNFKEIQQQPTNKDLELKLQKDIVNIVQSSGNTMVRKSDLATHTAKIVVRYITIFGILCFIVIFILFLKLHRSIVEPVATLIEGVKEFAQRNYTHRITIKKDGEFKKLATSFNVMLSMLEKYDTMNVSKLWIETIIHSIYDPIIILNENHTILFINKEALKIADLKNQDVIGVNIQDIAQTNIFIQSVMRDVFPRQTEKIADRELKLIIDGKENYFETKYLDLTDTSSKTREKIGMILLLQNITSHKKLDIAKTNFIASMSHNFKTPISSSQIALQLLRKNKNALLTEEQMQLVDSIEEDLQKILSITGSLLKISEVESENIQLKITSVDLQDIITYSINTIQRQADRKLIRLNVDLPADIPKVKGDAEKIAWVLINLISNAIRYSSENSSIRIQLESKGKFIYLYVMDQGQGIPPEYKDRIFARYFRAPGTNKKGTGLGLAISKEFMQAQGGSIEVESTLGEGSKFIVILKKELESS